MNSTVETKPKSNALMFIAAAISGGAAVAVAMTLALHRAPETATNNSPKVTANTAVSAAPAQAVTAPAAESPKPTTVAAAETKSEPKTHASCIECGVVQSVNRYTVKGEASGGGAVAGGLLGAVAGHQVGEGHGKDLATVIGAVGGAIAGNEIEKNTNKSVRYRISVHMDDGRTQTFTTDNAPSLNSGDKVKIVNGHPVKV